jgi:hypothetical protein
MFFFGLIIAAVIASFVAKDASKRGMNAVGWFLGVFFLLILFLPLYFIVRRPMLSEYQPQFAPQPMSAALATAHLCMHCGKYYADKARYCPLCGKPQDVGALSSSA